MRLKAKWIKCYVDKELGFRVYEKNGKNYLEKNEKVFELPSGLITIIDSCVHINDKKINIEEFCKK